MSSWLQQLDGANSVPEVVSVTRDYLSTWSPVEIALLPWPCRPGHVRDAEDIEELNACAVEAFRNTRASGDELTALQRLTAFLSRAAVRLAMLREPGADSAAPSPPAAERQRPTSSGR